MGSLSTTTSPMPSTLRPDGSVATGLRTVGAKRPARMPLSSVSAMSRQRSASQGTKVSRIQRLRSRCCSGVFTSPQQSMGPPGTPSNTMISQGPVVVSAGNTKYSPTPGTRLKDTAENGSRGFMPVT